MMHDGKTILQSPGMIYWYRWGRASFDIRDCRRLLGLAADTTADHDHRSGSDFEPALISNLSAVIDACTARGLSFQDLIRWIKRENRAGRDAHFAASSGFYTTSCDRQWGTRRLPRNLLPLTSPVAP